MDEDKIVVKEDDFEFTAETEDEFTGAKGDDEDE